MIAGQTVLGVIPARGGSKGVPRKNLRLAGGRPLIVWTIAAARGSRCLDRVIVSSDDDEILAVARAHGCETPFRREDHLAGDHAASIDVVLDAMERCPGFDWVVLLQPTSPLRTAADIDGALERCAGLRAPACVSVSGASEHPEWMFELEGGRLRPIVSGPPAARRQDLPARYVLNGAVYVARAEWLVQHRTFLGPDTVAYEMPAERSLDIDTEFDFRILEAVLMDR